MKRQTKILIGVIVLIILAGGIYMYNKEEYKFTCSGCMNAISNQVVTDLGGYLKAPSSSTPEFRTHFDTLYNKDYNLCKPKGCPKVYP